MDTPSETVAVSTSGDTSTRAASPSFKNRKTKRRRAVLSQKTPQKQPDMPNMRAIVDGRTRHSPSAPAASDVAGTPWRRLPSPTREGTYDDASTNAPSASSSVQRSLRVADETMESRAEQENPINAEGQKSTTDRHMGRPRLIKDTMTVRALASTLRQIARSRSPDSLLATAHSLAKMRASKHTCIEWLRTIASLIDIAGAHGTDDETQGLANAADTHDQSIFATENSRLGAPTPLRRLCVVLQACENLYKSFVCVDATDCSHASLALLQRVRRLALARFVLALQDQPALDTLQHEIVSAAARSLCTFYAIDAHESTQPFSDLAGMVRSLLSFGGTPDATTSTAGFDVTALCRCFFTLIVLFAKAESGDSNAGWDAFRAVLKLAMPRLNMVQLQNTLTLAISTAIDLSATWDVDIKLLMSLWSMLLKMHLCDGTTSLPFALLGRSEAWHGREAKPVQLFVRLVQLTLDKESIKVAQKLFSRVLVNLPATPRVVDGMQPATTLCATHSSYANFACFLLSILYRCGREVQDVPAAVRLASVLVEKIEGLIEPTGSDAAAQGLHVQVRWLALASISTGPAFNELCTTLSTKLMSQMRHLSAQAASMCSIATAMFDGLAGIAEAFDRSVHAIELTVASSNDMFDLLDATMDEFVICKGLRAINSCLRAAAASSSHTVRQWATTSLAHWVRLKLKGCRSIDVCRWLGRVTGSSDSLIGSLRMSSAVLHTISLEQISCSVLRHCVLSVLAARARSEPQPSDRCLAQDRNAACLTWLCCAMDNASDLDDLLSLGNELVPDSGPLQQDAMDLGSPKQRLQAINVVLDALQSWATDDVRTVLQYFGEFLCHQEVMASQLWPHTVAGLFRRRLMSLYQRNGRCVLPALVSVACPARLSSTGAEFQKYTKIVGPGLLEGLTHAAVAHDPYLRRLLCQQLVRCHLFVVTSPELMARFNVSRSTLETTIMVRWGAAISHKAAFSKQASIRHLLFGPVLRGIVRQTSSSNAKLAACVAVVLHLMESSCSIMGLKVDWSSAEAGMLQSLLAEWSTFSVSILSMLTRRQQRVLRTHLFRFCPKWLSAVDTILHRLVDKDTAQLTELLDQVACQLCCEAAFDILQALPASSEQESEQAAGAEEMHLTAVRLDASSVRIQTWLKQHSQALSETDAEQDLCIHAGGGYEAGSEAHQLRAALRALHFCSSRPAQTGSGQIWNAVRRRLDVGLHRALQGIENGQRIDARAAALIKQLKPLVTSTADQA